MAEIIEMPKLSDTMTTGTLIRWLKQEGDSVASGDMLAEVETDKATMEVENFEDGVLLKLYAQEGDSVAIGAPICAVGEAGEAAPSVEAGAADAGQAQKETADAGAEAEAEAAADSDEAEGDAGDATADAEPQAAASSGESRKAGSAPVEAGAASAGEASGNGRVKISPLARKIAQEKQIEVAALRGQGTGPGGRIVRADVERFAKEGPKEAADATSEAPAQPSAPPAPVLEAKELPVSNMRGAIARALVASKTEAPHFYLQIEVDAAPLNALRQRLNAGLAELPPEQGGIKFTVNDLILKAAAEAVRRVPAINRSWEGKTIRQHGSVHLAFGVAIEDGLVTPVIRDILTKSLRETAREAKALIGKARSRKLSPPEMQGSTLTVTNLGMYGISDFYGIINPPNAAILSVGTTQRVPVVDDAGQLVAGERMKVGLSGDHRVIDGAVGAEYLAALKQVLENPAVSLV